MTTTLLALFCLVAINCSARGQTVTTTGSVYGAAIQELVDTSIRPIVLSLPASERSRLRSVEIIIVPRAWDYSAPIAVRGPSRRILITDGFIHSLRMYAEALLMEGELQQRNIRQAYFYYYLWRRQPFYVGPAPEPPAEWLSRPSIETRQDLQLARNRMWAAALLDVLLHELGHHAEDAFYSETATVRERLAAEQTADSWATDTSSQYAGSPNSIGRILAIGLVYEMSRFAQLSSDRSHLPYGDRAMASFEQDRICTNNLTPAISQACALLADEINRLRDPVNTPLQTYRRRSQQGDLFGRYLYGVALIGALQYQTGCELIEGTIGFSAEDDRIFIERGFVHLGWCYEYQHLASLSRAESLRRAYFYYQLAANIGFEEARRGLNRLP